MLKNYVCVSEHPTCSQMTKPLNPLKLDGVACSCKPHNVFLGTKQVFLKSTDHNLNYVPDI